MLSSLFFVNCKNISSSWLWQDWESPASQAKKQIKHLYSSIPFWNTAGKNYSLSHNIFPLDILSLLLCPIPTHTSIVHKILTILMQKLGRTPLYGIYRGCVNETLNLGGWGDGSSWGEAKPQPWPHVPPLVMHKEMDLVGLQWQSLQHSQLK